jgi:4-hydroxybenzoate polyprenyltransferase
MTRVLAYAQLIRLPNVFTAVADIGVGVLATWAPAERATPVAWWLGALALALTSACLYSAGMVWNDVIDLAEDRRDRPERPLPAGKIDRLSAIRLGVLLLAMGEVLAMLAGWGAHVWFAPLAIASCLVVMILLYNAWLKQMAFGPAAMGTCRSLNVVLGFSLGQPVLPAWGAAAAAAVGLYTVGISYLAAMETQISPRRRLLTGGLLLLTGLLAVLTVFDLAPERMPSLLFVYMLAGTAFAVGQGLWIALEDASPRSVQMAIKRAIFGLIALDAALAVVLAGPVGMTVLLLLIPALVLGRWLYST